jgi:hypothetical protein
MFSIFIISLTFCCTLLLITADYPSLLLSVVEKYVKPIVLVNNVLYDSTNSTRWYGVGSSYEYSVDNDHRNDWLPAMQLLTRTIDNINLLRIYNIDPYLNYDKFLNYTATIGLYLLVPLSPSQGFCVLNRDKPPPLEGDNTCYPSCLLSYAQAVINQFSYYPNILAYITGNEVMNTEARWAAAPCVKAFTRDVKAYQRSCAQTLRYIPLMYTAADNPINGLLAEENDRAKLDYLTCNNEEESIDIFGLNIFRWCSDDCTEESCGLDRVYNAFLGSRIPILFTEYGCAEFFNSMRQPNSQRTWKQVPLYYSSKYAQILSGGSAFAYGDISGMEFAFFTGGNLSYSDPPGLEKKCEVELVAVDSYARVCNVDEYSAQLKKVDWNRFISQTTNSSLYSRAQLSSDWSCPSIGDFDLSLPPTRQGAEGYIPYFCPTQTILDDRKQRRPPYDDPQKFTQQHKARANHNTSPSTFIAILLAFSGSLLSLRISSML